MRTRLLAIALLIAATLAVGAATETATVTIRPGDNWIALPLVPIDPSPQAVLPGAGTSYTLTKFDPTTQEQTQFNSTEVTAFGNLLLAEGYLVHNPTTTTFVSSYTGLPDGVPDENGHMTDMWISVLGISADGQDAGGLNWVGHPFNHSTPFDALKVTDGMDTVSMQSAISLGWIDPIWRGWDSVTQQEFTVSLSTYEPDKLYLQPGHMYKVMTGRDQLALIVPANTVPEPSGLLAVVSGLAGFGIIRRRGGGGNTRHGSARRMSNTRHANTSL